MWSLIEMAREKGLLDNKWYKDADSVRSLGNRAAHAETVGEIPKENECKQAFDLTRHLDQAPHLVFLDLVQLLPVTHPPQPVFHRRLDRVQ